MSFRCEEMRHQRELNFSLERKEEALAEIAWVEVELKRAQGPVIREQAQDDTQINLDAWKRNLRLLFAAADRLGWSNRKLEGAGVIKHRPWLEITQYLAKQGILTMDNQNEGTKWADGIDLGEAIARLDDGRLTPPPWPVMRVNWGGNVNGPRVTR